MLKRNRGGDKQRALHTALSRITGTNREGVMEKATKKGGNIPRWWLFGLHVTFGDDRHQAIDATHEIQYSNVSHGLI